ncbi:CapA family protein [Candidatus Parcubacteria bacterium]|nr:CapA family protein [Candidatus Parcubacteria bacterium]
MKQSIAHALIGLVGGLLLAFVIYGEAKSAHTVLGVGNHVEATLIFTGDIMLGRNVETLMNRNGNEYPFQFVTKDLLSVDAVISNFEGTIVDPHVQTPSQSTNFSFKPEVATLLRSHNVQVVTLGNNHTYDHGVEGFSQTENYLAKADVDFAGHPYRESIADVLTKQIGETNLHFLSFNGTKSRFDIPAAITVLKAVSATDHDPIVAIVHWGDEYVLMPNAFQIKFAHALIDNGAAFVIGHHPHVVQSVEMYKGRPIFYSLGNFIFDQYFSRETQEELALKLTVSDSSYIFDLLPLESFRSQPKFMENTDRSAFLTTLSKRSSENVKDAVASGHIVIPIKSGFGEMLN